MAKKQIPAAPAAKSKVAASPSNATPPFIRGNLAQAICCIAYLLIHFIPNLEAYDAMGPQWLYIIILDMAVVGFLLVSKSAYDQAAQTVFGNIYSKLYLAFFLLAGLSFFAAINKTEFWVCFVRMIGTVVAFFSLSILLYNRINVIKWLAQVIAIVLLVESLMATVQFLKDYTQMDMSSAILNIKGNTGNKNIFSAGLIVKIPFVLYCLHRGNTGKKILNAIILAIGVLAILLANARAAYLSLFLITLIYLVFCLLENRKEKNTQVFIGRVGFTLTPVVIGILVSQLILSNVLSVQDSSSQTYGAITDRLGSINASGEDNLIRLNLWSHAIDYTQHHPLMGCGYGNWKLACIPYIRTMTNDLFVPVHSHNDFLETFAELGIAGGLLFLALFVCIAVFTIKTYFSEAEYETKLVSVFSLLAFLGYSVDAFFNFPVERPINQVFFAMITAINVIAYIHGRQSQHKENKPAPAFVKSVFGLISLLLLLPSTYVTYQTYRSLIVQREIMPDLNNDPLKLNYKELFPKIPPIPDLSATGQPLDAIKGRYLSEAGKYDEAIALLNKGYKSNPFIGYSEFLKAGVFVKLNKLDSAKTNATVAYYTRPKAKTYFQTLVAVLALLKDTAEIQRAFNEYNTYRPSVFGYDMYLKGMRQAKGGGTPRLLFIADSAFKHFDSLKDPEAPVLLQRKSDIQATMLGQGVSQATVDQVNKANTFYQAGLTAFMRGKATAEPANRKDYQEAANNFVKAGNLVTNNYVIYENAGIAYFNMKEYNKAIVYFDKAIALHTATDGKSEYFKGVSLYNTQRKAEGCESMRQAAAKGYAEANTVLQNNCK